MERVNRFIESELGRTFGFMDRPDFFETIAILFLAKYDPEIRKGVEAMDISDEAIKQVCANRDVVIQSLRQAGGDHEIEHTRSLDPHKR